MPFLQVEIKNMNYDENNIYEKVSVAVYFLNLVSPRIEGYPVAIDSK